MATKQYYNSRIQQKIDTYDNWKKATNFIPLKGEIIIYTTDEEENEITSIKIGDGETGVNNLPFAYSEKSQVQFITWEEND